MLNRSLTIAWTTAFILTACTVVAQTTTDWSTQAGSMRGRNGQTFNFACPAGGTLSSRLWGTDLYTDDSSICTAAVHAGLISATAGGTITIEIRPGQSSYAASTRNGVASKSYGSWGGSFAFVTTEVPTENPDTGDMRVATWTTQADSLRGRNGQTFTFACPAGGSLSSRLWGTDRYTDDSSICTAAVHAGLISATAGGGITIEILPGQPSYAASTRNGVASKSFGSWGGSFAFAEQTPEAGNAPVGGGQGQSRRIDWNEQANAYRGRNGETFAVACPAGGTLSTRVWGTDLYTDDSSICTAAVHAGLVSATAGGTVTIEIRPGQPSYAASTRNGVASKSYGSWGGSFAFVTR